MEDARLPGRIEQLRSHVSLWRGTTTWTCAKTVAGSDGGRWRETAVVLVVAFGGLSGAAGAAVVVEIKKKKIKIAGLSADSNPGGGALAGTGVVCLPTPGPRIILAPPSRHRSPFSAGCWAPPTKTNYYLSVRTILRPELRASLPLFRPQPASHSFFSSQPSALHRWLVSASICTTTASSVQFSTPPR